MGAVKTKELKISYIRHHSLGHLYYIHTLGKPSILYLYTSNEHFKDIYSLITVGNKYNVTYNSFTDEIISVDLPHIHYTMINK